MAPQLPARRFVTPGMSTENDFTLPPEVLAEAEHDVASAEEFIDEMVAGILTFQSFVETESRLAKIGAVAGTIKEISDHDGAILIGAVAIMKLIEMQMPASDG